MFRMISERKIIYSLGIGLISLVCVLIVKIIALENRLNILDTKQFANQVELKNKYVDLDNKLNDIAQVARDNAYKQAKGGNQSQLNGMLLRDYMERQNERWSKQ